MRTISKFLIFLLFMAALNAWGQQVKTGVAPSTPAAGGKGTLKVFSEPVGAGITLDSKPMGVTPLKIVNISAGEHRLAVRRQGYEDVDSSVKVTANATLGVVLKLVPIVEKPPAPVVCTLIVKSVPTGAALSINGEPSGATPFRNDTLMPGTYKVRLEMAGHDPVEGSGTLKAGESRLIEKKLVSLYGSLAVTTTPSGASLFLNDKPSGVTPFRDDTLAPGDYGLKLELAGYEGQSEKIVLAKDSAVSRQYSLAHSKAWLDSVKAYKVTRYKRGRMVRRIWFASLAAAAGGTAYYFETRVASAVKDQKEIQGEYREATVDFDTYEKRFDKAGDRAKSNALVRNILYGVAGGFGFCFLISIPF
jgi:hypothetical protein